MSSPSTGQTIMFVIAMEREAAPLRELFALKKNPLFETHPIMDSWNGEYAGINVAMVLAKPDPKFGCDSIGPESAAVVTYIGVETFKPDLIISSGTAGAYEKEKGKRNSLQMGDICYAKENGVSFIDREIVFDDFKEYMEAKYEVAIFEPIFEKLGFKETAIGTTTSFYDYCKDYSLNKKVDIQEMEAASVGKMAYLLQVPFLAIKVVSNVEYEDDKDCGNEFWAELDSIAKHMARKICELMVELANVDLKNMKKNSMK